MPTATERPARDAEPAAGVGSPRLVVGTTIVLLLGFAALVVAAVLSGGGSSDSGIFPLGAGAAALALVGACAALAGIVPRPTVGRAGCACIGLLCALALWSGLSVLWSIAPGRSWDELNRELAYVGFLCVGVGVGVLVRRATALVAAGLGLLVVAALCWSLAAKVFPSLDENGGHIARLQIPVGYWNALALLFALGLPVALWVASERRLPHAVRALAVVFLYGLVLGSLLTLSRGGILVGVVVLVLWLALGRHRLESLVSLAIALPLAGGVFAFTLGRPGVVDDGQAFDVRVADGHAFGLALLLGALVVFAVALGVSILEARRPVDAGARRRLRRRAQIAFLVVIAAGAVAVGVRGAAVAGWVERQADEFANPPTVLVTQEASRLVSLSSNNRWTWWNEAWDAFTAAPANGNGAGSFATVHVLLREDSLTVTEPHNAVLQLLADTGVIGAILGAAAAAAALVGAYAALRRVPERERQATLALAIGVVAYVLHSLVDFDWQFVAVTAPVLVATGVLFAAGRPRVRRRGELGLSLVGLAAVGVIVVSLGAPWLATRKIDDVYVELGAGRPQAALATANDARSLDPLSLDALLARADAQTALGDVDGARETLVRAVELQPLDYNVWYFLGAFELDVANRPDEARRYLERSQELNRFGPAKTLLEQIPG